MDIAIAKIVFTCDNMKKNRALIVDKLMMELPGQYLDMAEYGEDHNEVEIRQQYIEENKDKLTPEEQRSVMTKCVYEELNNDELQQLEKTGLLGKDDLLELYRRVQRKTEEVNEADGLFLMKLVM